MARKNRAKAIELIVKVDENSTFEMSTKAQRVNDAIRSEVSKRFDVWQTAVYTFGENREGTLYNR